MKKSLYNFFVPYEARIIIFNAMSGKIFSANNDEFLRIKEFIDYPNEEHSLFKFFFENGFIVDDSVDEIELLKLRNRLSVFENTFHLIINPTLQCNFNCWYCYEKNTVGHMNEDVMNNVKEFMRKMVDKKQISGLNLSWFGGEPLLNYCNVVHPLSLYLKELMTTNGLTFSNSMTTNGYCINEEMIKDFNKIDLKSFQITLDGNRDTHNQIRTNNGKPSFDKIIKNIIELCTQNTDTKVRLRINYTNKIINQNFGEIFALLPMEIRKNIIVDFQRVWQTANEVETPGEDNKKLVEGIKTARNMCLGATLDGAFPLGKAHQCYVDRYYYAHINFNGKVYKCTARDYSEKYVCGNLTSAGTINWKPGILENMHVKANFDNELCTSCNLLPLCIGPCYQNYLDYKKGERKEFCIKYHKEISIETFIIDYYLRVKNAHKQKNI